MKNLILSIFYSLPKPICLLAVNALTYLGMNLKYRFIGPRICHLTLPSTCDHNCPFCITDVHGKGRLVGRKTISYEDVIAIIDKAIDELTLKFNFTSNGEPLLYPQLKQLITYIHTRTRGKANIQIITNGTSLKTEDLNFYKDKNVSFWISLHSPEFESWIKMHQPLHHQSEKFEKLKNNIAEISKLGIDLTLHCVVTKLNYKDLIKIPNFLKSKTINYFSLTRLIDFEELKLSNDQERELEDILLELKNGLNLLGVRHNLDGFEIMLDEQHDDEESEPSFYELNRCYMPFLMRPITDSGYIKSCNGGPVLGSFDDLLTYKKEEVFLKAAANIRKSNGVVDQCQCSSCPQLVMNKIANKYCF